MFKFKRLGLAVPPQLAMVISFAATSLLNYVFGIMIGWLLLPGDYGLVAFAQTIILICGLILNSGLAWSLSTRIALTDDPAEWARLIRGSLVINLGLSLVMSLLLIVFFEAGLLRSGLETRAVTLAVAGSLPFLSIIAIVSGTLRGAQAFGSLAAILTLEVVFKTAAGLVFVRLGYGPAGALAGFAVGGIVAAACGHLRVRQITGMTLRGPLIFLSFRQTLDMFGALIGMALLLNLDIIFVKIASGDQRDTAGFYQSATMLANLPYYLANSIFNVMFAQIVKQKNTAQQLAVVGSNLRIVFLFFIPIAIGLMIAPEQIIGLIFPPDYLVAAPVLSILALGNLMLILTGFLSNILQAMGKAVIPAIIFAVVIPLECFALLIVVPQFSMTGASLIFGAACALTLIVQAWAYVRLMPGIPWRAALLWFCWYLGCLIPGILTYQICMALAGIFLVSVIAAVVVYFGLLLAMDLLGLPMRLQRFFLRAEFQG